MSDKSASNFWSSIKKNISKQRQQAPIQLVKDKNIAIPLSYNQEQLWQLDKLNPNSVHNIANALKFELKLDFAALEASLREIVRRHSILRTVFPVVNNKPVQKVISETHFNLPIVNLQEVPQTEQEAKAKQIAVAEKQKPFDLVNEPGFKAKVVQLAEAKYILLLTVHHIIFDGVSFGIFFKELKILYAAFSQNKPNSLPELAIQYTDFAYWQRQLFENSNNNYLLTYWQKRFAKGVESLKLPQDNLVNTAFDYEGKSVNFKLSPELTKKVKSFSSTQKVTLFTTLLTTFKILLFSYTQQTDIMLISPDAGRNRPEVKDLIGYFNNMLVLRSNIDRDATFLATLALVDRTITEAREHQDFTFKQITELPSLAAISLSRAMFSLSNYNTQAPELSAIKPTFFDIRDADAEKSNFDLSVSLYDRGARLTGIIKYKTALFSEATVKQIIANYQSLLEKLLDNPQIVLNSLPVKTYTSFSTPSLKAQDKIGDRFENQTTAEISAILAAQADVKQAFVVPQAESQNTFIAYILPSSEEIELQKLAEILTREYTKDNVNCTYIILDRLPLNSSGNLDLETMSYLPLTEEGYVDITQIPVADWQLSKGDRFLFYPFTITQEMVAQIWAQVLELQSFKKGISQFIIYENFFELGGHSLATIRLLDSIWQVFQIRFNLQDLFANPTIFGLAEKIDAILEQRRKRTFATEDKWQHLVPIKVGGKNRPLFLIPGGDGGEKTLMLYAQLLFLLGEEQPVYGLKTYSLQDSDKIAMGTHVRVETLATAYVKEIRQLQPSGVYSIAGECIGGIVAFEVAQQLKKLGCQVDLILLDTLCPKGISNLYSSNIPLSSAQNTAGQNDRDSLFSSGYAQKNYINMVGGYQPQTYKSRLTIIVSQHRVSKQLVLNWRSLAETSVVHEVPGDHESYLGEFVETTARQLKFCLDTGQNLPPAFGLDTDKENVTEDINFAALASTKNNPISHRNYSNVWRSLAESERLKFIYQQALKFSHNEATVYTYFGHLNTRKQKLERATNYYLQALEIDPFFFGAYKGIADILCQQKQFTKAITNYQQAIKMNPRMASSYIALGRCQIKAGKRKDALKTYQKGIKNIPKEASLYIDMANLHRIMGDYTAALATFELALKLEPQNIYLHRSIGLTHQQNGNLEAAINCYQEAIALDQKNVAAYTALGSIYLQLGKDNLAIQTFEQVITIDSKSIDSYNNLGKIKLKQQDYDAAKKYYLASYKIKPEQIEARVGLSNIYNHLGNLQFEQKDFVAAAASYRNSLKFNPNLFGIWRSLGHCLRKTGSLEEASEAYQQAALIKPDNSGIYVLLGDTLLSQNKPEQAIVNYRRAIELDSNVPERVYQNLNQAIKNSMVDN